MPFGLDQGVCGCNKDCGVQKGVLVRKPKCLVKIGAHATKIAKFLYQFACMVLKTKIVYHCGYGTNCQASIAKNCVPFAYRC